MSTRQFDHLPPAGEIGRTCAIAGRVQRDLHLCTQRHAALFPPELFGGPVLSAIALANTFASPWLTADRLRPVNRAALWTFGLDRLVDLGGTTEARVVELARACQAAVEGLAATGPAREPLGAFLAEVHDELTGCPGYPVLGRVWRSELDRLLTSQVRERHWVQTARAVSVEEYLANADGLALAFVTTTHAVAVAAAADRTALDGLDDLLAAVRLAQRGLRLVNDLATYDRDVRTGDLNALRLGLSRGEALARIGDDVARARAALAAVRPRQPALATHVLRQLEYNLSFYAVDDYWDA